MTKTSPVVLLGLVLLAVLLEVACRLPESGGFA